MTDPVGSPLPLRRRARVLVGFLGAAIVVDLVAIGTEIGELAVLSDLDRGVDVSRETVDASDLRAGLAALAQLVLFIATVVAFLAWFFRAYRNLARIGAAGLRYRPGWSIGAWFVPILNLFRPKQIANDVWRASDPELPGNQGLAWRNRPVSALLHWWWALWLISSVAGNASNRAYLAAGTIDEQQSATQAAIAADALYVITAILAILVVRAVTGRQETRAERLRALLTGGAGGAQSTLGDGVPAAEGQPVSPEVAGGEAMEALGPAPPKPDIEDAEQWPDDHPALWDPITRKAYQRRYGKSPDL